MIKSKEILKNYLKQKLNIEDDTELELITEELMRMLGKKKSSRAKTSRIWKKEEIEAEGIEVKPVKWKKLD